MIMSATDFESDITLPFVAGVPLLLRHHPAMKAVHKDIVNCEDEVDQSSFKLAEVNWVH